VNDDDISELILRASAYLDGELDADEMARAEADPAVMAEVEQLRALQDEVRHVEPPSHAAREAAITAALAEFDARHVASPGVLTYKPRPAYARWLGAAAAVVAVGAVGVVIAQGGGDDESTDSAAIEALPTADAADDATAGDDEMRMEAAAEDGDAELGAADAEMAPEVFDTATQEMMDAPMVADTAAAEGGAAESGDASEAPAATEAPAAMTTTLPVDGPVTEDILWSVGVDLLDRFAAGELTTPNTDCTLGGYEILARVDYVIGDTVRDALIAADPELLEVGAFDADTCQVIQLVVAP
jgi:hypothetical protein